MHHSEVAVLVPAAGRGARLGGTRKQFRHLGGAPLLVQTLRVFERHPEVDHLVVAAPAGGVDSLERQIRNAGITKLEAVVAGGATRQASVGAALRAVPEQVGVVLVHDAVRPFVEPSEVAAVIDVVRKEGAAALAITVADTVRRGEDGRFGETISRDGLFRMQTPQGARRDWFEEAHARAVEEGYQATDDVELVQRLGHPVQIVPGGKYNIKITTPGDWELAQWLWPRFSGAVPSEDEAALHLQAHNPQPATHNPRPGPSMRIGMGYDVHRLVEGRPLILGGVTIPHEVGLAGHSDADVLLHAITDALLGAAALGDIGTHFPDTDEQWRGADSRTLLEAVKKMVRDAGYRVANVDASVALQRPKIRPHIDAMRRNIARVLEVDLRRVSVKATTTEGLGFVGSEEGVAAYAICVLQER